MLSNNYFGYLQYSFFDQDSSNVFNIGSRFNYMNWTNQLLISPRVQYQYRIIGLYQLELIFPWAIIISIHSTENSEIVKVLLIKM